jgi:hypothetical protein
MGYDKPGFFQEVDDRLTSFETGQQEIRSTLHQVEWQQQTTQRINELRQYEQQQQTNFEYLFSKMGFTNYTHHHHHHLSDLAWGRTPAVQGETLLFSLL